MVKKWVLPLSVILPLSVLTWVPIGRLQLVGSNNWKAVPGVYYTWLGTSVSYSTESHLTVRWPVLQSALPTDWRTH